MADYQLSSALIGIQLEIETDFTKTAAMIAASSRDPKQAAEMLRALEDVYFPWRRGKTPSDVEKATAELAEMQQNSYEIVRSGGDATLVIQGEDDG